MSGWTINGHYQSRLTRMTLWKYIIVVIQMREGRLLLYNEEEALHDREREIERRNYRNATMTHIHSKSLTKTKSTCDIMVVTPYVVNKKSMIN